jgi:hypothetical protein
MTSARLATAWGLLAAVAAVAVGCGSTSSTGGSADGGNPPGCPAAIPNATLSCTAAGLQCTYGCGAFATCRGGTWTVTESNITCGADSGAASDGAATCSSSADCHPTDFECSPGGVTIGCGICAMPQNPCSVDSDCTLIDGAAPTAPMVCGPAGGCTCPVGGKSGSCIPACQSASDCSPDESCAPGGHCVAKTCTTDAECPSTQTVDYACSATGTCAVKSCQTSADCGAHYCVSGACYPQAGMCVAPAA